MDQFTVLIGKINSQIVNPLMLFLFSLGTLYFFWGFVEYFYNRDNAEKQEVGKKHMIYGALGMFIMFSVFGIMNALCQFVSCQ